MSEDNVENPAGQPDFAAREHGTARLLQPITVTSSGRIAVSRRGRFIMDLGTRLMSSFVPLKGSGPYDRTLQSPSIVLASVGMTSASCHHYHDEDYHLENECIPLLAKAFKVFL